MDTDAHEWESELTEVVIGAGFLEKVYERALIYELALRGVSAKAQVSFPISYKGKYLGEYVADLARRPFCPVISWTPHQRFQAACGNSPLSTAIACS